MIPSIATGGSAVGAKEAGVTASTGRPHNHTAGYLKRRQAPIWRRWAATAACCVTSASSTAAVRAAISGPLEDLDDVQSAITGRCSAARLAYR